MPEAGNYRRRHFAWAIPPLARDISECSRHSLVLFGVLFLLPNVAFLVAGRVWSLKRPPLNLDYAVLALLYPWLGRAAAPLAATTVLLDVLVSLAYRFHGNPAALLDAAGFVRDLPVVPVLAIAGGLLALAVFTWAVLRLLLISAPRNLGPNIVAALLSLGTATGLSAIGWGGSHAVVVDDFFEGAVLPALAVATQPRGISDANIPSASGPLFRALERGEPVPRRIELLLVESLGRFRDPELERLQLAALDAPRLAGRYRVVRGTIPYQGATVFGELRELCHAQAKSVLIDSAHVPVHGCLPMLLREHGYNTIGVHGFQGSMFRRDQWWPQLGLQVLQFLPELAAETGATRRCGTLFRGMCDDDAGAVAERDLARATRPTFVFWVTLNAHWPLTEPRGTPPPDCDGMPEAARRDEICRLLSYHQVVLRRVTRSALTLADGSTGFIIVGDHTPVLDREENLQLFDPSRVPYLILWPKQMPLDTTPWPRAPVN